ncbi:hypothetical protein [Deinococcus daejeonensis]|uniref:hypothetical protein n=1 Tax=Deinococcus daejeonensis TaxID=1007098 RepID=UPI00166ED0B2|nr:hypothetical protein [Deinococcus daejeonensis]
MTSPFRPNDDPNIQFFEYQWPEDPVWDRVFAWNVSNAVAWVDLYNPPVDVLELARVPDGTIRADDLNVPYALSDAVRLDRPLISVLLPADVTEPVFGPTPVMVVIDGNHRLYKAKHLGVEALPMVTLPDQIADAVRISDEDMRVQRARPTYKAPSGLRTGSSPTARIRSGR